MTTASYSSYLYPWVLLPFTIVRNPKFLALTIFLLLRYLLGPKVNAGVGVTGPVQKKTVTLRGHVIGSFSKCTYGPMVEPLKEIISQIH